MLYDKSVVADWKKLLRSGGFMDRSRLSDLIKK